MNSRVPWRPATPGDLDAIMAIQDQVHTLLPERREIFADKMKHFGEGCMVLADAGTCLGYGIAHSWMLGAVPPLDTPFGALPALPDCLFIHDVALLPPARGRGAAKAFIAVMSALARREGWAAMALVSVYGTYPIWESLGFATDAGAIPPEKLVGYGAGARYMIKPADHVG